MRALGVRTKESFGMVLEGEYVTLPVQPRFIVSWLKALWAGREASD